MRKVVFSCICAMVLFAGCDLKEEYERTVDIDLSINAGQKLIVTVDVGSVKITGGNDTPHIKAVITGKADTKEKAQQVAESIEIVIDDIGAGIAIKINKPLDIKSSWFKVNYTIDAPAGICLAYKADVGCATVLGIKGDITASCDVGNITCKDIAGKIDLRADVGNIHAYFDQDADPEVNAYISVDVGNIKFKGPEGMSAILNASTDVGHISSDFPVTIKSDCCSKKVNGTIGDGKGSVTLKTDVGLISIKKK